MKKIILILGVAVQNYTFAIELCDEPTLKASHALKIVSEYHLRVKTDKAYVLESLSYNYVQCNWHAVYSMPVEKNEFPESHTVSYVYTFTNKADIQLFKF